MLTVNSLVMQFIVNFNNKMYAFMHLQKLFIIYRNFHRKHKKTLKILKFEHLKNKTKKNSFR